MQITIQTDADFTPAGKRRVRVVKCRNRMGVSAQIRLYVSGRIFRKLAPTPQNMELAKQWVSA